MNNYEQILERLTQINHDLENINQLIKDKFNSENELG